MNNQHEYKSGQKQTAITVHTRNPVQLEKALADGYVVDQCVGDTNTALMILRIPVKHQNAAINKAKAAVKDAK